STVIPLKQEVLATLLPSVLAVVLLLPALSLPIPLVVSTQRRVPSRSSPNSPTVVRISFALPVVPRVRSLARSTARAMKQVLLLRRAPWHALGDLKLRPVAQVTRTA